VSLDTGTRIGPYEILASLGAGGMGEVYRARDTRLDRDVAIKILPSLFAADADRVARFEREAKTLALLNHPNIAAIYGIETGPTSALNALVMELVEGPTLEEMIHGSRTPMSPADVIPIARQIAEALEAAHEQGIVHRDLKPANVKVRPDGTVKVLDFGLAKALDPGGSAVEQMNSPTLTARATQLGIVVGTAAYMAPEQAKGKPVDRRADIWAFGVMLHEMLTGQRLYGGETAPETLAHVIASDPNLTTLPPSTPPRLRDLIARCLVKDPRARLRDIGEARLALADASASAPAGVSTAAPSRASLLPWGFAGAMLLAALAFATLWWRAAQPPEPSSLNASIEGPPGTILGGAFALSPDGTRLVLQAFNVETGRGILWLRDMATGTVTEIRQTDGGGLPFWSPDGRHLAYFADAKLKKLDLQNGVVQVLADAPTPRGGSWSSEDRIVFAAEFRAGLQVVDAKGGAAAPLTKVQGDERSHRWPVFLPDGRHVVFLVQRAEGGVRNDTSTIEVMRVDGSDRKKLLAANSSPLFSLPGFLMFWKDGVLYGQAIDPDSAIPQGVPFVVANDVSYDNNEMMRVSVSATGRLVYMTGQSRGRVTLEWLDRTGRRTLTTVPAADVNCGFALSPEGTHLAVGITPAGATTCDQWVYDLDRGTPMRLTFDDAAKYSPLWSRDGATLFMGAETRDQNIVKRPADGSGKPEIVLTGRNAEPLDFSRDASWMLLSMQNEKTVDDLLRFDLATKKVTPVLASPFAEYDAALSPDDRFVAYVSDRSGTEEVYVSPVAGEGLWQVSSAGGVVPRWHPNGRELFYLQPPDRLMSVDVLSGTSFKTSAPKLLFRAPFAAPYASYEVAPDGKRFIAQLSDERQQHRLLTVVSDWRAALRK
jgi:eukaryotic-like serine/threonine-protein kinase